MRLRKTNNKSFIIAIASVKTPDKDFYKFKISVK